MLYEYIRDVEVSCRRSENVGGQRTCPPGFHRGGNLSLHANDRRPGITETFGVKSFRLSRQGGHPAQCVGLACVIVVPPYPQTRVY